MTDSLETQTDSYHHCCSITAPTVPFEVVYRDRTVIVSNPTDFPETHEEIGTLLEVREPMVNATIIVPQGQSAGLLNNDQRSYPPQRQNMLEE